MANNASNETTKKRINMIVFAGVAVAVVVAAFIAVFIMFNNNSQKPAGTVQFMTNPSCTMVINNKDRVIEVKYDNEDAETIFSKTNLEGKTINEAAQLFVKLSCEAGYIDTDYNSNGQKVEIIVTYNDNGKIDKLQNQLISTINKYFDENGVIAAAVCSRMDELKQQAQELGTDVNLYILSQTILSFSEEYTQEELLQMSEQDLLDIIKNKMQELEGVACQYYNEYSNMAKNKLQELENKINAILKPVFEAIGEFDFEFTLDLKVGDLETQINSSQLSQQLKDTVNNIIKSLEDSINKIVDDVNAEIEEAKNTIKEQSDSIIADAKKKLESKIEAYEKSFEYHKQYFKEHKKQIQQRIQQYRDSLVATKN